MSKTYIKKNSSFSEVSGYYRKEGGSWVTITQSDLLSYMQQAACIYDGAITSLKFEIAAPSTLSAESCQCLALLDHSALASGVQWSIISGSTYASIDNTGLLTISSGADESNIVIGAVYNTYSTEHTITATYKSGSTTETTTEVTTEQDGTSTVVISTVTENEDGSSYIEQSTEILDGNGNTVGTSESTTTNNADGSYESASTSYDVNGEPTSTVNEEGDTSGNISTQQVGYNSEGEPVVTGYEIDTTASEGAGKDITGDGVNTEFVPFADDGCGFVMHIKFETDRTQQPRPPIVEDTEDTGSNWLYNIMGAKSATPLPTGGWPGFDIRWALSKSAGTGNIQFRYTQAGSTTTTSKNLTGKTETGESGGNFYDIIVTYDPELVLPTSRTTFSVTSPNGCMSSIGTNITFVSNNIDFTLGYALNMQGEPYRYSNVTIHEFSITKIRSEQIVVPDEPIISCDGEEVTISCETSGAIIYYRLGTTGTYLVYSSPISISSDTTVYAYSELMGQTSDVVSQNCIYDNGITEPVIDCDGIYVTIVCETPSVDIYYKLDDDVSYTLYDSAIQISSDTVVYAYAYLNGKSSSVVSETCIFDDGVKTPVISCINNEVTITCATTGATIYYRLDQGTYTQYTGPITIIADTTAEAYASLNGITSSTASELCEYDSSHDYSLDYLTLDVLTSGTIKWNSIGSGQAKTVEYSKNDGTWTSITASSSTTISVVPGDKVRFKGTNTTYAKDKNNYSGFEGGTANFNIEGNMMSLVYGDNFASNSSLPNTSYLFCSIFKKSNVVSAENLILPAMSLKEYCYRAMFSYATLLTTPPALPATTLAKGVYWYMFEQTAISTAPDLVATTLLAEAYGNMFNGCSNLNYIRCLATTGFNTTNTLQNWVSGVASSGTFIKDQNTTWSRGTGGIPTSWTVFDEGQTIVDEPVVSCDGEEITITCATTGADIYYRLGQAGSYTLYSGPISILANTYIEAYAELDNISSLTVSQNCEFISSVPIEESNRDLKTWRYDNQTIETPYSVNRIDGHSSYYAKGTFNFETSFALRQAQPTYLWFQHADQSATIYVDDVLVEKHWGGYTAFFVDISNYVHAGTNNIKVGLKNNEGNNLAPAAGDFNFNATLGNVKLLTSPVLPAMRYGYDGFHVTSDVTSASATVYVKTSIPAGGVAECIIDDGTYHFQQSANTTGEEMTFMATIQNPHLWNGTTDPHLYTITLNIYYQNELYHSFQRDYGLRFYEYVINQTVNENTYTGFLLNGSPYFLRGVCMHDDLEGKANALNDSDYTQEFAIIQELGCNFIRLAHYPHPKEVYDWCDRLGIVVQTEAPCVNKLQSTMGDTYYNNLVTQYNDMVNQHYNHPCIMFWGLSNETTTDDKDFGKAKIEQYTAQIKALDSERLVGYVMSHSYNNPSTYYNNPNVDWFGCNIYVGWYIDKGTNDPTSQINTRVNNIINGVQKPLAFSEYGCGGTQHCHSEDPQTTTTKGNYERHDIEYQMWLHEGHIAAIRNFPQLLFTGQWQLFDIAVSNRNEGYTVCLDGETVSTDDSLRRLNNKGLVERDHITKKDTFYLYKAEWNTTDKFVHICGKDYTRMTDRVIKCYSNDGTSFSLYVNGTLVETSSATNNIVTFTSRNFSSGDIVRVDGLITSDTFTFN